MARRVLIELPSFDRGGLQKVVLDVAIGLKMQGYTSLIVTTGPLGQLSHEAQEAGIQYKSFPQTKSRSCILLSSKNSDRPLRRRISPTLGTLTLLRPVYQSCASSTMSMLFCLRLYDRPFAMAIAMSRVISQFPGRPRSYVIANLCIDPNKIEIVANGLDFPNTLWTNLAR